MQERKTNSNSESKKTLIQKDELHNITREFIFNGNVVERVIEKITEDTETRYLFEYHNDVVIIHSLSVMHGIESNYQKFYATKEKIKKILKIEK